MLDLLLASDKRPYVPGGKSKKLFSFNFNGTRFSIELPAHYPADARNRANTKGNINYLNKAEYGVKNITDPQRREQRAGSSEVISIFTRSFGVFGFPFGIKCLGSLSASGTLLYFPTILKEFSLFNPAHLEQAAVNLIYYTKGPGAYKSRNEGEISPINWRITTLDNGLLMVRYDAYKEAAGMLSEQFRSSCIIPIDRYHALTLHFSTFQSVETERCYPLLRDLRDEILETVKIELSDHAKKELEYAQKTWPDATISQDMKPIEWEYDEGHYEGGEFVVTEKKAFPPEWKA
ncbi:hypothetical protein GCM10007877_09990 [Marinibactrum halimedae]|uniref:Uncharacterized protein n=2 Tax=Marinibactrum halimedae TaxID=1444977 RepID=A0AA37T8H7_9GAMM|nr:hypothetical protein GCM10007877_09990 [Marinibactrum halimedae]